MTTCHRLRQIKSMSSRPSGSEWRDLRIYGLRSRWWVRRSLGFARDDSFFRYRVTPNSARLASGGVTNWLRPLAAARDDSFFRYRVTPNSARLAPGLVTNWLRPLAAAQDDNFFGMTPLINAGVHGECAPVLGRRTGVFLADHNILCLHKIKSYNMLLKVTEIVVDKAGRAGYNTGVSGVFRQVPPACFLARAACGAPGGGRNLL